MTRRGKIARLPQPIREQVNRRLENGVEGKQIVQWLNSLPKVKKLLAAEFDGQPVNEQNLSNWKLGGYQDWLSHQEALDASRQFAADAAELEDASGGQLAAQMAVCLTARSALAMRNMPAPEENPAAHLEWLRVLSAILCKMRRGEHDAQWLDLKRDKHELDEKKFKAAETARKREQKERDKERGRGPVTKEAWEQMERDLKLL